MKFDAERDFPYYKHNPRVSKKSWIGLLILIPVSLFCYGILQNVSELLSSIVFCLVLLLPLLYVSGWDYKLFIRKPSKNEILLGALMFIGYTIYSIIVATLLENAGMSGTGLIAPDAVITAETFVSLIFSMFAEELLKFIPLMCLLRFFYKYTQKRRLSIVISAVIVMVYFGMLHYAPPYSTLASVLLLQGFGSIFEIYGYIRTKNLAVSYISHILTDAFSFAVIFLGGMLL